MEVEIHILFIYPLIGLQSASQELVPSMFLDTFNLGTSQVNIMKGPNAARNGPTLVERTAGGSRTKHFIVDKTILPVRSRHMFRTVTGSPLGQTNTKYATEG